MTTGCPIGIDVDRLREHVRTLYDRVACSPASRYHFHTGLAYAVEVLRYPRGELAALPEVCTARFAGVGNPHRIGALKPGATVLDHACGSGMDLLLAARHIGPAGRAIGVDLTPSMRECAAGAAIEAGLRDVVEIRAGTFEDLPVDDASIDYVISNGVLNLAPDKTRVFAEIVRVLKPGGELRLADVVLSRELAPEARRDADLWTACVGGAVTEPELATLAAGVGLERARVVERFECFRGTSRERKFHGSLEIGGASFLAVKPHINRPNRGVRP